MGVWLVIVLLIPAKLGGYVSAAAEAALLCVDTFALNNIEALKAGDGRIVTKDEVLVDFAKHIEDNIDDVLAKIQLVELLASTRKAAQTRTPQNILVMFRDFERAV
jgi:hypothetical protein